ncbi:hypothetical protein Bca52824_081629 [Brassica carinata]|uniref:Uncharacterized protein n=1 Tax=Brassica carinata TaxID=52824 RepID=A0A8X7PIU0_BRACI|nr:hypothetical protein Bca52824_081629 [Brassica carinata]
MNGIHHTKRLEGDDVVHINMNLQDGSWCCKRVTEHDQVHSTGIQTYTRHIPSFSFRNRSLSREKSCQARDSNFSSSLTIEDGFSYASFEDVAMHWSGVNAYKPEISVYLEYCGCAEREREDI